MKRDMDLVRLILLEIENKYRSTAIYDLAIDGYDTRWLLITVKFYMKQV